MLTVLKMTPGGGLKVHAGLYMQDCTSGTVYAGQYMQDRICRTVHAVHNMQVMSVRPVAEQQSSEVN